MGRAAPRSCLGGALRSPAPSAPPALRRPDQAAFPATAGAGSTAPDSEWSARCPSPESTPRPPPSTPRRPAT
eukprot:566509-Rhodomonas_salina.1